MCVDRVGIIAVMIVVIVRAMSGWVRGGYGNCLSVVRLLV